MLSLSSSLHQCDVDIVTVATVADHGRQSFVEQPPSGVPPQASSVSFRVLKRGEEYVLASSEKLSTPEVEGYDFNKGLPLVHLKT